MATRIYLAGPEVFLPDAREIAEAKKAICRAHGLEGAFPADPEIKDTERLPAPEIARLIAESNLALMDGCDCLIANLTPFRGVSMDTGTAFEMGYMASRGACRAGLHERRRALQGPRRALLGSGDRRGRRALLRRQRHRGLRLCRET